MADTLPNRCRLVLIAGPQLDGAQPGHVLAALGGGDVASLILVQGGADEDAFQTYCEAIVSPAQQAGAAVVISGDSRVAGRVGADGIHLEVRAAEIAEAVKRHNGKMIVGAGGAKTRHDALDVGEGQPDYIFFGRFGYDGPAEPHPRNLDLAEWWSSMIEIPCIIAAGSSLEGIAPCARTGAEFVALSLAVFGPGIDPASAVRDANALLDAHAPQFEGK